MIQVGDHLPQGQLVEFIEIEGGKLGPKILNVSDSVKGKRIAILALPRTFTRDTLKRVEACKEQGADEVWCLGGQDPSIMAAWSRDLKAAGKVRLMADGSGVYSQALGLSADFGAAGSAATRSSLLTENGVVKQLNVDTGGRLQASNDDMLVAQAA
jgi:peroxiredoxin